MERLFQSIDQHPDPVDSEIIGSIPDWLEGQLFQIGPAKWDFEGFTFNHWLDGCAMLYKFTIRKGKIDVMSKFLDTVAYQKITKIQRPIYTEFGTKSYPDPCRNLLARFYSKIVPLELTDNTLANTFVLDDELYAMSETCNVWKVDREDLSCIKRTDLKEVMSVNLASSHPHRTNEGDVYNLGASFLTGLRYHIIKVPPADKSFESKQKYGLERGSVLCSISSNYKTCFSYYHSFGLSEHYVLFLEQPLFVNTVRMAASGIKGYAIKECFDWKPEEKTRFHLIDNKSGSELKAKFQADGFFFFHHVNTYEEEGHVVADLITFPNPDVMDKFYLSKMRMGLFDTTCPPRLTRFVLPLNPADGKKGENLVTLKTTKATAVKQDNGIVFLTPEYIGEDGWEMPTINYTMCNTKKYRYVYGSAVFETGTFKNSLIKQDVQTGEFVTWHESETTFPGELNFIQRPGATEEDDGILVSVVLDSNPSLQDFLLVLDAKTFKELGRALVPSDIKLPPTVHGRFLRQ